MRLSGRVHAATVTLAACVLAGCGSGGGGSGGGGSDPAHGVYRGVISDPNGNPVAGAHVSIDGIEASAVTRSDGSYVISDGELSTTSMASIEGRMVAADSAEIEISVLAEGYAPYVSSLLVGHGEKASVDLVRTGLTPSLHVTGPEEGEAFVVDSSCGTPQLTVEGLAGLSTLSHFRLDTVLVIDRSGSTGRDAFDVDGDGHVDSVLKVEIEALRCFVAGLNPRTARVCVMQFNDSSQTLIDFTGDLDAVDAALASAGPASGGTNFEAAFLGARDAINALHAADAAEAADEASGLGAVDRPPAVLMVSDGIATSHGVPRVMSDSNLTQSRADRAGAISGAKDLGEETGAYLFAYSIIPAGDSDRRRSTLPHCVASCGNGRYESVDDMRDLQDLLCGRPLMSLLSVEIDNLTLHGQARKVTAVLNPDGSFSEDLEVALGPHGLVGDPDADGFYVNVIQVTLTAFSGFVAQTATATVTVRLMDDQTYGQMTAGSILDAKAFDKPVAQTPHIKNPAGGNLSDDQLHDFLVGSTLAEFEDAVQLDGVQTFTAMDPLSATSTLTVDFVFKEACYQSDVGYIFVDQSTPNLQPNVLMASVPASQVLFHSGSLGNTSCNAQSIAAGGAARAQIDVPTGSVLAFFVIPNRTLAQYNANPFGGASPHFTIRRLNPGGFQQALAFRSMVGRTQPGASQTVVTAGPCMIFAFDDMPITKSNTSQDFDDVVFTVANTGTSRIEEAGCAE